MSRSEALDLFISYAREDEPLRAELETHLSLLKRQGVIRPWHQREVAAGDEKQDRLDEHLEAADVILLLVSASFIASVEGFEVETTRALERHDRGQARVIPIIVRPCDWQSSPFARLQSLPRSGKPVTTWANRDEAWLDIVTGLRAAIAAHERPPRPKTTERQSPRRKPAESGTRHAAPVAVDPPSETVAAGAKLISPAVPDGAWQEHDFDPARSAGFFVGISSFEDQRFAPIPFAVDDAVDLAYLFAVELGLITPPKVVLGLAGDPHKKGSRQRLRALRDAGARMTSASQTDVYDHIYGQRRVAGTEGMFVAALATHGVSQHGADLLVAADSRHRLLERSGRTGVAVAELLDDVSRCRSPRRVVLLDACRERVTAGTRSVEPEAAMSRSFAEAIAGASGQAVLAGATAGGYAYDDPERGNGVFTGAILDGLRGQAGADEHGFITVRTLADYVDRQVVEWVRDQRPDHAAVSQGVARKIEGAASRLPLAVDPVRRQAEDSWRARRDAAVTRLRANLGETITGVLHDEILTALGEGGPRAELEPLLEEIETLDGSRQSQRSLAYYFKSDFLRLEATPVGREPVGAPPTSPSTAADPIVPIADRKSDEPSAVPRTAAAAPVAETVERELDEDSADPEVSAPPRFEPEVWIDPVLEIRFRLASPGTYFMGSPSDEPQRFSDEKRHEVTLSRGFWIAETVVTQKQWNQLIGYNPSRFRNRECPVEQITWFEAVAFANALSERAGLPACYIIVGDEVQLNSLEATGYRLPTEAEWEYAARAGTSTAFSTGPNLTTNQANYKGKKPYASYPKGEFRRETMPVRSFQPNSWGLYEVHGNVCEWVWDWFGDYAQSPVSDPAGELQGSTRIVRGGGWNSDARECRSAYRGRLGPGSRSRNVGFRLARTFE